MLSFLWRTDLDAAMAQLDRAIEHSPNTPSLYATRGYVLSYLGEPARAVVDVAVALRLEPDAPNIWLHFLGHAHYANGSCAEAAQVLEQRIRRQPNTDISHALLAACYGHLGRSGEAQAAWRDLLQMNPDYSLVQKGRILPYRRPEDRQHVLDGLQKAGLGV